MKQVKRGPPLVDKNPPKAVMRMISVSLPKAIRQEALEVFQKQYEELSRDNSQNTNLISWSYKVAFGVFYERFKTEICTVSAILISLLIAILI